MTPFLQFRVWLRRGPTGERLAAALAAGLLVVLIAWTAVPVDDGATSSATAAAVPGSGAPAPASGGGAVGTVTTGVAPAEGTLAAEQASTAASPSSGAGGSSAAGAAAPSAASGGETVSAAAGGACSGVRATDQGVSATEVLVAWPIISLAGAAGNSTFGLRSPDETRKAAEAIAAAINGEGGAACRKVRVKTYEVNPLDPVDQQSKCRQIVGDKPFAVVDNGGFLTPESRQCILDAKIPYEGAVSVSDEQVGQAYPYLYSTRASVDRSARNFILEAPSRGWFDPAKGFKKVGVLLNGCYPKVNSQLLQNLRKVGVRDDQMSVFTLSGCFSISPPNETQAAMLQHRNAGVSHVILAGNGLNSQQYVRQADGIGWRPRYLTSDYGEQTESTLSPDWTDGFDGAIAITSQHTGERNSGIVAPWVNRCNDWLKKGGVAPSASEIDQFPMNQCDLLRLFAGAASAVGPGLTRATLIAGLEKVGRFESASDTLLSVYGPRKVTGGDQLRALQWHKDCTCWKVLDRDPKPGH